MLADRSLEEEIKIKAQEGRKLARYMSSTEDLVEEQIRKAQARGDFDNLAGAGKPVDLSENPYENPDLRMTYKILKNNDFAPFWIELGKEIDANLEKFWESVAWFKRYTEIFMGEKHSGIAVKRYEKKRAHFYYEKRLELEKINKKILDYNLHCPTFRMGRASLLIEDQMYKVITEIEQIIEDTPK
jgi:hypothetical protein